MVSTPLALPQVAAPTGSCPRRSPTSTPRTSSSPTSRSRPYSAAKCPLFLYAGDLSFWTDWTEQDIIDYYICCAVLYEIVSSIRPSAHRDAPCATWKWAWSPTSTTLNTPALMGQKSIDRDLAQIQLYDDTNSRARTCPTIFAALFYLVLSLF